MKKDKLHIHWYPGHIAKAEKKLKEQLSLVDAVIEVIDARLPLSSSYDNITRLLGEKPRLILLNKSDLTNIDELKKFIKIIENKTGFPAVISDAKNSRDLNFIVKKAVELSEPKIQALMKKGLLRRPARVMVVGMPNVGKSSIINKLTKSSKTKTGAKAGVVNAVSENAYSSEAVAIELLELLAEKYAQKVKDYYNVENLSIEDIAQSRNWIVAGGNPDIKRTSVYILRDFREGKIGKFILDEFPSVE